MVHRPPLVTPPLPPASLRLLGRSHSLSLVLCDPLTSPCSLAFAHKSPFVSLCLAILASTDGDGQVDCC
uniref:Uncharacterized protein n=1 Tax=Caenorhabditis japonica TaxID=281687 RepID=A0A8R1IFJ4_CAEJA